MCQGFRARVAATAAFLFVAGAVSAQKIENYTTRHVDLNVHSGVHTNTSQQQRLVFSHPIRYPDTAWCRLDLSGIELRDGDFIRIIALRGGARQEITVADPQVGEPVLYSNMFLGGDLDVQLWLAPGSAGVQLTIDAVLLARGPKAPGIDSICGLTDDRTPIIPPDPCIVRIVDTQGGWGSGFMISNNWCITAHHVMTNGPWMIQRNVPASSATGAIQPPAAADSFTLANLNGSMTSGSTAPGNDWAVLFVPNNAMGAPGAGCAVTFNCSWNNSTAGQPLTVDGFGIDSQLTRNGVAQTHTGPSATGAQNANHFTYRVDTRANNSGSRVTDGQSRIVGIHTLGGCNGVMPETGANSGTLISNPGLVNAIQQLCGVNICPECWLVAGFNPANVALGNGDVLLVELPWLLQMDVTLQTFPAFPIPNEPTLNGLTLYGQVLMYNPTVFPFDPIKTSNGMRVVVGHSNQPYGPASGMTLFSNQPPLLGGVIDLMFSIQ